MTTLTNPAEVVWQQTRYDSGLYCCSVERRGDEGVLTVALTGLFVDHVLHEEPVKLDRMDLDKWRRRCIEVIGDPGLRSRAA